jgi:4-hydroxy-2-oxoheptanedioate aldolase
MYRRNVLKESLQAGRKVFGPWVESGSPAVVEVLSHAGYDFLVLDNEHGPADLGDTVHMLRAAQASDTTCIIRVPSNDPIYLKRIIDAGAQAVMIPMIMSAQDARAAVGACRYPPAGHRSYAAGIVRASTYGHEPDYMRKANENLLVIAQIEHVDAVPQAAEIAAVDGVDMVLIGPNDLAGSIGLLEQLDDPRVQALVQSVEKAVKAAGKTLGTVPMAGRDWPSLFADGYDLVAASADLAMLRLAAVAEIDTFRKRFRS